MIDQSKAYEIDTNNFLLAYMTLKENKKQSYTSNATYSSFRKKISCHIIFTPFQFYFLFYIFLFVSVAQQTFFLYSPFTHTLYHEQVLLVTHAICSLLSFLESCAFLIITLKCFGYAKPKHTQNLFT